DFCDRRAQGEEIDPDEYCAQFPSVQSTLGKLVHVHLMFEEHQDAMPDGPEAWPEAGQSFAGYNLILALGKGSFAQVFLATEPKVGGRLVVLKIALRGAKEADILGRIQHPNIVPIHSVHEDSASDLTAVCMPYLGSATLCDVRDQAFSMAGPPAKASIILEATRDLPYPLDPGQSASPDPVFENGSYIDGVRFIGAKLADALALIHDRGICHRDLKPSNVLVTPDGVPMLLDFNLCADARETSSPFGGTLRYMAPEQLQAMARKGESSAAETETLDARADLFSLGVILYELATGRHPFGPTSLSLTSNELRELLLERQRKGPVAAHRLNPDVDPALSALIQRCLAWNPHDRPENAAELVRVLRPQPAKAKPRRWFSPLTSTVAAAIAIASIAVAGLLAVTTRPADRESAEDQAARAIREGKHAEALVHLNAALEADANNHRLRLARARTHQRLGAADATHYQLAIQDYLAADAQRPDGRCKAGAGFCLNRLEATPELAIKHYQEAIQAGFMPAEVYNNLGYSYLKQRNLKEAARSLDRAIQIDPGLQAAYHNRALVAYRQVIGKLKGLTPASLKSDSYLTVKAGAADAQKAIDCGTPSAELVYDAARLCAIAGRVEGRWIPLAIGHLGNAIQLGYDTDKWTDTAFDQLRTDARFQALVNGARQGQPQPPTERLVDPLRRVP
ncbi:MAG: protein kinase, partial [Planctomycetes bacterium]|nr:protein kinase [Planctomycetota bacterium]